MAIAVGVQASEGREVVVAKTAAVINASQVSFMEVYNKPSMSIQASQAEEIVVVKETTTLSVSEAQTMVVVRGHVANPYVRVFTFTLDEHDMFVVQLGDVETLVYDTYSQQWPEWDTPGQAYWRANCGMNWIGAQKLATGFGSDIVIGDDTWGLLWFLNPTQAYDDAPDPSSPIQQLAFTRIVMGQVTARGRENIPCYAVFLDGDNHAVIGLTFAPQVTLETSDDQGVTFDNQGTLGVVVDPSAANDDYMWASLGQISSPGRLFRITDNGVFARIDSLEMNDAQ